MTVKQLKAQGRKISIRAGRPGDAARMWEIDQACFEPGVAYPMDIFYYHLMITRDPAYVAVAGDVIIGFVLTSKAGRLKGIIVTIDILDGWRRQGLGSSLMNFAENSFKRRGCGSVQLQVAVDNNAAIGFYEKMGYKRKKLLRDYYGPGKDGRLFSKRIKAVGKG